MQKELLGILGLSLFLSLPAFCDGPEDLNAAEKLLHSRYISAFTVPSIQRPEPAIEPVAFVRHFMVRDAANPNAARRIAEFPLDRKDLNRKVYEKDFGPNRKRWSIGIAGSKGFSYYYGVFEADGAAIFVQLNGLAALNVFGGYGVPFDDGHYLMKPVGSSRIEDIKLVFAPLQVKPGDDKLTASWPSHIIPAQEVLQKMEKRIFQFQTNGNQKVGLLYSLDVDRHGKGFDASRTFLFIRQKPTGFDAWPVPEDQFPPNVWKEFDLVSAEIPTSVHLVVKRTDAKLLIFEPQQ